MLEGFSTILKKSKPDKMKKKKKNQILQSLKTGRFTHSNYYTLSTSEGFGMSAWNNSRSSNFNISHF